MRLFMDDEPLLAWDLAQKMQEMADKGELCSEKVKEFMEKEELVLLS